MTAQPTHRPNTRQLPTASTSVVSRRTFALGALSGVALAALSACGADTAPAAGGTSGTAAGTSGTAPSQTSTGSSAATSSGSASSATSASASGTAADGVFPVSVQTKFGAVTVPSAPSRVVSVGLTEQDFLLALGIVPVGVTDWYGDQPNAIWPWAKEALGSAPAPTMLTNADGIQTLKVAKLRPDLIIGVNSDIDTQSLFDTLNKIAPTVATPSEAKSAYFDSWRLYLELIGTAVGKSASAAALEQSIDDRFAAAAKANPEFAGKNAIFLQGAPSDGNLLAYNKGLGTEFLTDLGFDVPSSIDKFVPAEGGQALIPVERIDELAVADHLIWATESDSDKAALEALPGFADLPAVKAGRSVYTGAVLSGAIYFSSPLSLPYIVDTLVPMLQKTT